DIAVGGIGFDPGASSQNRRLIDFIDWDAVVEVLDGFFQDAVYIDFDGQAGGRFGNGGAQARHVQRAHYTIVVDVDCAFLHGGLLFGTACAFLRALFTIQDVGASHVVLARTHQGQ